MAIGQAEQKINKDKLALRIGSFSITAAGGLRADYDEGRVAEDMKGAEIDIDVDGGVGRGRATGWTCDLTHRYIAINADYRS